MNDTPDLDGWAEQLSGDVQGLRGDMQGLRTDVRGLTARMGRAEGWLGWLVAVVVAVALACGVGIALVRSQAIDARVDAICPMLALFVGSNDPSTRPSGPQRDAYVAAMAILRKSYVETGCAAVTPLVPPRTGGAR